MGRLDAVRESGLGRVGLQGRLGPGCHGAGVPRVHLGTTPGLGGEGRYREVIGGVGSDPSRDGPQGWGCRRRVHGLFTGGGASSGGRSKEKGSTGPDTDVGTPFPDSRSGDHVPRGTHRLVRPSSGPPVTYWNR